MILDLRPDGAALAFLLQLAVDQAPDLIDSHDNKAARRVLIAGLFVLLLWMVRGCWLGLHGHPWTMFGLSMVALAEVAFCINRLFPDFGTAIERTVLHREPGR